MWLTVQPPSSNCFAASVASFGVPTAFSTTSGCEPIAECFDGDDAVSDGTRLPDGRLVSDGAGLLPVADAGADGVTVCVVVIVSDAPAAALCLGLRNARNATTSTAMPSTAIRAPARRSRRWRRASCRATRPCFSLSLSDLDTESARRTLPLTAGAQPTQALHEHRVGRERCRRVDQRVEHLVVA